MGPRERGSPLAAAACSTTTGPPKRRWGVLHLPGGDRDVAPWAPATVPIGASAGERSLPCARPKRKGARGGCGWRAVRGGAVSCRLPQPADATADRFVPIRVYPGCRAGGFYRTGAGSDASRPAISSSGRIDLQMKVRGFRVEPGRDRTRAAGRSGGTAAAVALQDDLLIAYVNGAVIDEPAAQESPRGASESTWCRRRSWHSTPCR